MSLAAPLGLVLSLGFATAGLAAPADVSSELRQSAIDDCSGDALRLCPLSLTDERSAVGCMAGKRQQLSAPCRATYDRVARVLRR